MKRWVYRASLALLASYGTAAPLGKQMDELEGLRGVQTAKLGPLQTFEMAQYRRAFSQGEVATLRVATLNCQLGDVPEFSEEKKTQLQEMQKRQLQEADADLIVLQELDPAGLEEVKGWLGSGYAYRAVGTDTLTATRGFIFRKTRLEPVKMSVLPIPPANHAVIRGTWRLRPEGVEFTALAVHLPPHDPVKRQKQAEMLAREVAGEEMPLCVLGDFNTWPYRPADKRVLYYDGPSILEILKKSGLRDATGRGIFGHLGAEGDFLIPAREGLAALDVALARVMVNAEVELVLSAIPPAAGGEQADLRRILVVDLALPVEATAAKD